MGVPAWQAGGTIGNALASVDLTVAWPTHQFGDLAILCAHRSISSYTTFPALTTPNGFKKLFDAVGRNSIGTTQSLASYFWCVATSASMASPVINHDGFGATTGVIQTFRGADWTLPLSAWPPGNNTGTTTYGSANPIPPRIITNTLAVAIFAIPGSLTSMSGQAATGMTNVIERYDARSGNAGFVVVTAEYSVDTPAAGFTGTFNVSAGPAVVYLELYPPRPTVAGIDAYNIVTGP